MTKIFKVEQEDKVDQETDNMLLITVEFIAKVAEKDQFLQFEEELPPPETCH